MELESSMNSYLSQFEELKQRAGDAGIAAAILHELAKDRRAMLIRAERAFEARRSGSGGAAENEAASAKQREYLKDLGVSVPEGLSRVAASRLISEALAAQDAE